MPLARAGADLRGEPGRRLGDPAAGQLGACQGPLAQGGGLGESVPARDVLGDRGMGADGGGVAVEGGDQGEHGVLVGQHVALPGAFGGGHAVLCVRTGPGVPSRPQLRVGEQLQGPGHE